MERHAARGWAARRVAVLACALSALLLAACGGDDGGNGNAAGTTPTVLDLSAQATRDRLNATAAVVDLRTFLQLNRPNASWWVNVSDFEASGDTITVQTDMQRTDPERQKAVQLCNAVSEFVFGNGGFAYDLGAVRVLAADANVLVERLRQNDVCAVPE